jgi:ABC-type polysaccharide/polyol phosphate transport system ATPase subunit
MTIALEFARASKQFTLQHERPESLQDRFVQIFRRRQTATTFWALRDVSFQVTDGETFGILGRNGAGKSTLLKLATGILQPSSGRVAQHRRTYAMLELGAGFHPELTGRDNVLLNGSIHGLSRADTRAIFDQIVDFAELEPFIDTPVKHYSSGMFMRLGFATAIHMKPELLVIDEILAVGDAAFRRKCTDALWALKRQGVTILFVSHNEEAVYQFCDRALLLVDGQVAALGPVQQVVGHYTRLLEEREAAGDRGRSHLAIQAAAVLDAAGRETLVLAPDQPWAIDIAVATPPGRATIEGTVALETETGGPVIVAPLRLDVPDDGAHLRQLRATFATLPLHNGRLRLHVRLTARSDGQLPVMDEYLSPQSITVGEASYGPLLKVAPVWTDRTAASQSSPVRREVEAETAALDLDQAIFARYFAEGITGPDGATRLDITNPSALPAQIVLRFG